MPKLNVGRTVTVEGNLARRIAAVRKERGQSHETLAALMTKAGCAIAGSSIYKIESGNPRRRISVDELWTLAEVWGFDSPAELTIPPELVERQRAREIAEELPLLFQAYEEAIINGMRLYLEYGRLAENSPELLEYMNNHAGAIWDRPPSTAPEGLALGDNVSEEEVAELQQSVLELWGKALRLATKAAQGGEN